ncbi:hypothetical protein F5Y18DRAFT_431368 [Xylariaceae sp. FL1019]|nr:hypothetical protein F5Y18DRAFT_431368 [Xylariaceae sp. FL1019]
MDAIDVYSEWVDAADAVAKDSAADRGSGPAMSRAAARPRADREVEDEEDDHQYEGDGIVGDDEEY